MLNLSEIYKDLVIEDENGKKQTIKSWNGYQCENCGQEFSYFSLTVAIFLYGVFFLTGKEGKEVGYFGFNQKNSSMLCIGVNRIKIHFDTSQLCCGVVHFVMEILPL